MHIDHLIKMANQIGDFFETMPVHDEALLGIATHLKNFWEPRMRRELLSCIDGDQSIRLKPIIAQAIKCHRDMLA